MPWDAASVEPGPPLQAIEGRPWRRFAADIIPIVIVVVFYFLARGLVADRPSDRPRAAFLGCSARFR